MELGWNKLKKKKFFRKVGWNKNRGIFLLISSLTKRILTFKFFFYLNNQLSKKIEKETFSFVFFLDFSFFTTFLNLLKYCQIHHLVKLSLNLPFSLSIEVFPTDFFKLTLVLPKFGKSFSLI